MVGNLYKLVALATVFGIIARSEALISAMIIKLNAQHLKAHRVVETDSLLSMLILTKLKKMTT